ncbi:MAG: heliorhodopsin HeR [Candidatus Woesebacteria bacterium]
MSNITMESLRRLNVIAALLHAGQAVAVILLAKDYLIPVTTSYLTYNVASQSLQPTTSQVFQVSLAWLTISFLIMSSVAHLIIATVYRRRYEADLKRGINKARWVEYAISASTMMVAIAFLSGIYDLSSLIMIFALVAIMNLMGLVMEVWNQKNKKVNWLSYAIGCIAGLAPWLVFVIYVMGAANYGSGQIPTFVYWIYVSIFIFFNSFAVNMFLQYRQIGRWKNYLYGERVYIVLSLVAKSALAWQVFAGTLRP